MNLSFCYGIPVFFRFLLWPGAGNGIRCNNINPADILGEMQVHGGSNPPLATKVYMGSPVAPICTIKNEGKFPLFYSKYRPLSSKCNSTENLTEVDGTRSTICEVVSVG